MARELLIAWLNDAYAMENALLPILENHAADAQGHPEIQARIYAHGDETKRHADLVRECVEKLGSSTSAGKTGLGTMFGYLQSVSTGMFSDESVKNALTDYATEHFEIACYRAIAAAAQQMGEQGVVTVCQNIIRDEQAMAEWLADNLPMITQETVSKQQTTAHSRAAGRS
jgi:ferritin-like metal-binding protein YciE